MSWGRDTSKWSRLGALLAVPASFGLSGCGVVASLMGVEFETVYSPQQQEVYFTTLETSMMARTGDSVSLPSEDRKSYLEFGEQICAKLQSGDREEVVTLVLKAASDAVPSASESSKRQFAEMFILAATAQGSLCQEYR